jgi:hypothetical protein
MFNILFSRLWRQANLPTAVTSTAASKNKSDQPGDLFRAFEIYFSVRKT